MTRSCPHCNTANRDTAQFCAQCAQPLRQVCSRCGADNPSRSRFCNQCGASLAQELHCPQCSRVNPAGSRFCNGCGAVLSPTPSTPDGTSASGPAPSTGLSATLRADSGQRAPQPRAPGAPFIAGTGQLPPQTMLVNRYIILRQVGKGGMGAVYQASDARIPSKTWAVKEMSDAAITNPLEKQQSRTAFRREALMLASLDHPNLPAVTDHFAEGGKQYLVMDFIEGETLADRLERGYSEALPTLPDIGVVVGWAEQLCDVLEYLHSRNPPVIFRDLKPANVMITPEGTVKLIDFGIARIFKPGKTADTAYFGTTGYSPKEQYGKGQTDARSDIYALGALLHHLLTGIDPTDQPFHFEDVSRLNSQVPIHVADAVMKALSEDPADRWQSVVEMKAALTKQSVPEPKPDSSPRLSKLWPKVSAAPQPAMGAAASADAIAASQPVPVPAAPHLNFWRGLGLTLLGAALHTAGAWLATDIYWEYDLFPTALFACIPTLFGVLFGPWVGGSIGALGLLTWSILAAEFGNATWGIALGHCTLGILSGLMVKDARNWKAVLRASVVASVVYALAVSAAIGLVDEEWGDFWIIASKFLIAALPANILLLPLFARWLVGSVHRRGLYWRDFH